MDGGHGSRLVFSWRVSCRSQLLFLFARRFFQGWKRNTDPHDLASQFRISTRTVQRLYARFEKLGDDGIAPDYQNCGSKQAAKTDDELVEQILETRRDHRQWGAELIRVVLEEEYDDLPNARTLRRYLRQAGLNPAPAGRRSTPDQEPVPRATRPHQGWQVDASEEIQLKGKRYASWLRFVDECSGAFLRTTVYDAKRWAYMDRHVIQNDVRNAFSDWGIPDRMRFDNGYPFGSTGDFPPEMALWLIGLGIEMIWIHPGCPQQNGVVERAQGTGKNWSEPKKCRTSKQLQKCCDKMDYLQRERYPYRDGASRGAVYPELAHSGHKYNRRTERQNWDLSRVLAAVSQTVCTRKVDSSGSVSVYNRTRYIGKSHTGKKIYVSLDATGPTWVFSDANGNDLRTHQADELTEKRIRSLTVGYRKPK